MRDQPIRYEAYYYNPERDQFPGVDSNELSVNGKYIGNITSVRSGYTVKELAPTENDGELILLVPQDNNLGIVNFNPCPDE